VVLFTLQVAAAATALLLVPGIALAWLLARPPGSEARWRGRVLLETLVSLPLVLPPTAVGLGLLLLFGREGPLGAWLYRVFGWEVVFTRAAVVLACAVMALPLLVRSARSALEEVDPRLVGVARTLGRSPLAAFLEVHLPLAWRGVLAGVVLAFTRALGEFGATILVAGNIPGRTQTLALALFQEIQMGRDAAALRLAGVSALLAFVSLLVTERLAGRRRRSLEEG
jgi:molybdate transport system permease protein